MTQQREAGQNCRTPYIEAKLKVRLKFKVFYITKVRDLNVSQTIKRIADVTEIQLKTAGVNQKEMTYSSKEVENEWKYV